MSINLDNPKINYYHNYWNIEYEVTCEFKKAKFFQFTPKGHSCHLFDNENRLFQKIIFRTIKGKKKFSEITNFVVSEYTADQAYKVVWGINNEKLFIKTKKINEK